MARNPLARLFYNFIGTLSVSLGVLGIFLPLLPTTPFLLLALACYMRGSQRMSVWMLNNSLFGEHLRNFQIKKAIPKRTKIWAISLTWVSLAISAWIMSVAWARPILILPGLFVTIYLWRYDTLVE
ncbi:MAG TPA: YbaN family protein [Paenalcaligenes sp.]|nr:YbaN family protein [Paenalcaligenes sp.]HLS16285.1 YbaN family protein [Paenalcaligenes sp.]